MQAWIFGHAYDTSVFMSFSVKVSFEFRLYLISCHISIFDEVTFF
jgi:hypothetical protein